MRAQFLSEWDAPGPSPVFEKVYEVALPRDIRAKHEQYRASNPGFQQVRSFHASQCICDLGTKEAALCSFKSCGICSIVKSSFKTFTFGISHNNGRSVDDHIHKTLRTHISIDSEMEYILIGILLGLIGSRPLAQHHLIVL